MSFKLWTQSEILQLKNLAETNSMSYKDIGKIMNRSGCSCQSQASTLGIRNKYNEIANKKYTVNEDFWSIPNEINCYWAGMSAADAYIYKPSNTYKLEIQKSDEQHLLKLVSEIGFSGVIKETIKPERKSHTVRLSINSKKWINDIHKNFGITQRKAKTIMPPNISDHNLLTRWLIGYTDGDGSINLGNNNRTIYIKYVSCNPLLMEWIKKYFDYFGNQLRMKGNSVRNFQNKYHIISIGGLKAAQFIDHVNSLGIYCLERKWKNPAVLEIINSHKQKYPQFFEKTT